jgi:hypothetical protein
MVVRNVKMTDWKSVLNANPTEWLLEQDNSSVRYNFLTDILERPVNELAVRTTRDAIMKIGVVPKILAKQEKGG